MSVGTRQISRSTLGRYVGRYQSPVDRYACRRRYSIAKPSTLCPTLGRYPTDTQPILYRHSADTLPTLGQYSTDTWSALSARFFFFSNCSRLRCPLHLVPALSVTFVLYRSCRHHSSLNFLSAYLCFFFVIAFTANARLTDLSQQSN